MPLEAFWKDGGQGGKATISTAKEILEKQTYRAIFGGTEAKGPCRAKQT